MIACAYIRSSTKEQISSLEIQNDYITKFANDKGYTIEHRFIEQVSGRKDDRKQLLAALEYCKKNNATLIVKSIDRLGRKSTTIQTIYDSGINIIFVEQLGIDRFTLQIMSVVYENEVTVLRSRIKQGMNKLKESGNWTFTKIGTKNFTEAGRNSGSASVKSLYDFKNKNIVLSIENIILKTKTIHYSNIANQLTKLGTKTLRGNEFSAEQVKRIVTRYDLEKLVVK